MRDREREKWIDIDQSLHVLWRGSHLSKRKFAFVYKDAIDSTVDSILIRVSNNSLLKQETDNVV